MYVHMYMYMCTCMCIQSAPLYTHARVCVHVHVHMYSQWNYAITFFVAVFAGPEAIQRAHPTSEPCPSTPTVVKNGQFTY